MNKLNIHSIPVVSGHIDKETSHSLLQTIVDIGELCLWWQKQTYMIATN